MPANVLLPNLLPAQCEDATQSDAVTGKKIQSFGNWSPRLSATYDLFGTGKTSVHASGSYYYATKITLADSLNGLFTHDLADVGPEPVERRLQRDGGRALLERRQRRSERYR